jgi:ATP-dependent helicase/nuclease subunit A
VWAGAKDTDVSSMTEVRQQALTAAEDEYRRLLYVAMTRAANRLVICGIEGRTKRPDRCWYNLIFDALKETSAFVEEPADDGDGNVWRYRPVASGPTATVPVVRSKPVSITLPEWLRQRAPEKTLAPRTISPSSAADESQPRFERSVDGNDQIKSRIRGTLIHRLMRSLPDIVPDQREHAARQFLTRQREFSPTECEAILVQIFAVLNETRFAPLFAADSRAEVPIVGRLQSNHGETLIVSGQVDRLAVTADTVLVADYKTNRPAPRRIQDVPNAYITQLGLYRTVLAKLYPRHVVRAALLWTDVPDLMEFSPEALDAAVRRVISP